MTQLTDAWYHVTIESIRTINPNVMNKGFSSKF